MRAIDIRYCAACGQLQSMESTEDAKAGKRTIRVGCDCGAEEPTVIELPIGEMYYLQIETKQHQDERASSDEDDDSSDVLAQHEPEAEEL